MSVPVETKKHVSEGSKYVSVALTLTVETYATTNAFPVNMYELILPLLNVISFVLQFVYCDTLLSMSFIYNVRDKTSFAASNHFCLVIQ